MEFGAVLTGLANAISVAKALKSIEASYDQATLKVKIAEIYDGLTDAKMALVDAKEEIAILEKENSRLKQTRLERDRLVAGEGGYEYFAGFNGYPNGYPVCPKCNQVDSRLILLVRNFHVDAAKCPACEQEFQPVVEYVQSTDGSAPPTTQIEIYKRAKQEESRRISEKLSQLGSNLI